MIDNRPVCSPQQPLQELGLKARHPDARAVRQTSNPAFEDELWECPDCGYRWWKEGADS